MAIEIKTDVGAVIKFDSVEEYREFMIINGKLDPVLEEEDVDMEKLPTGTLVKVVGNRAGHWHKVGEILPITEVNEGNLNALYRLDGRTAGWVSVDDIEFVSFPEEEESTIKAGDTVIATEDGFDITEGVEYEIHEDLCGDLYFLDDARDVRFVLNHEGRIRKKIIEAIEEPKLEVGIILRCNKDSMYVSEGKLYEVLAIDRDGDAVYMDDGNSVSYVNETDIPERFEIL